MSEAWGEVISFYHEAESKEYWCRVSMEALVKHLIENRDLSKFYPVTSHDTLCLSKYKTYDEWRGKPSIAITPASTDNYWFSLIEPLEDGEVYREKRETISCPIKYALRAYDELMGKLEKLES